MITWGEMKGGENRERRMGGTPIPTKPYHGGKKNHSDLSPDAPVCAQHGFQGVFYSHPTGRRHQCAWEAMGSHLGHEHCQDLTYVLTC